MTLKVANGSLDLNWCASGTLRRSMPDVFKSGDTLQCGLGQEIPLTAMETELNALGATILNSEKRPWPGYIPQVCGAPTG